MWLNQFERRNAIIGILSRDRRTTTEKLASELNVSARTIRKDITALSLTVPILTVRGRYGGGIELAGWFHPYAKVLAPRQEELLQRMKPTMTGEDLVVLNSILVQFSPGMPTVASTAP